MSSWQNLQLVLHNHIYQKYSRTIYSKEKITLSRKNAKNILFFPFKVFRIIFSIVFLVSNSCNGCQWKLSFLLILVHQLVFLAAAPQIAQAVPHRGVGHEIHKRPGSIVA